MWASRRGFRDGVGGWGISSMCMFGSIIRRRCLLMILRGVGCGCLSRCRLVWCVLWGLGEGGKGGGGGGGFI